MRGRLGWPAAIGASAMALDLAVVAGQHGPLRLFLATWFLMVCTGMAFVPLLAIPAAASELLIGVAVSIALDAVVTTAIVEIGGLSLWSGLLALEVICLAGCVAQLRWPRRRVRQAS